MLNDHLVIDAVAHCYNLDVDNMVNPDSSQAFRDMTYKQHTLYSPRNPGTYLQTPDEFIADCKPEWTAHALFAESQVDMAAYHAVPLFDFFKDGLSSLEKGVELKERHPNRILLYGTCNPLEGRVALESIDVQIRDLGVDGIKLYPAVFYGGHSVGWRMDDPTVAYPIFERMLELGLRNVAVHKAVPLGPADIAVFNVDDLVPAARQFPEMNFQIVHGGLAFMEETTMLVRRFENVHINLESTMSYCQSRPRHFAEVLGNLLYYGSPEQLLFATGCNLVHPRPIIDAFWDFVMPEDLIEGYDFPPVTEEIKAKVLGENFARLHDIDISTARSALEGDEFELERRDGFAEPWALIREGV